MNRKYLLAEITFALFVVFTSWFWIFCIVFDWERPLAWVGRKYLQIEALKDG